MHVSRGGARIAQGGKRGHRYLCTAFAAPSSSARGFRASRSVRVLEAAALAGLSFFVLHVQFGTGGAAVDDFANRWLYNALILVAVAMCALRTAWLAADRAAWVAITVGLAFWAAGEICYDFVYAGAPPYPSIADVFYLGFYPPLYVGLVLLVRSHLSKFNFSVWLDGVTAALAGAALGAAVLLRGRARCDFGEGVGRHHESGVSARRRHPGARRRDLPVPDRDEHLYRGHDPRRDVASVDSADRRRGLAAAVAPAANRPRRTSPPGNSRRLRPDRAARGQARSGGGSVREELPARRRRVLRTRVRSPRGARGPCRGGGRGADRRGPGLHGLQLVRRGDPADRGARFLGRAPHRRSAAVSDRPYRPALATEKAIEELRRCAESQFDPGIVEAFCRAYAAGELAATPDQPARKIA
jgi:hypothetical protein